MRGHLRAFISGHRVSVGQVGNLRPIVNRPGRLRKGASAIGNRAQDAILPHMEISE